MSALELTQQSETISILAINGTSFSPGKKVIFELTDDLGFIKASRGESYLVFNLKNNSTARWMLATSGQCLIDRVDIFSMSTGQQLESLQNYGQVQWFLDQYGQVSHGVQQSTEGMRSEVTSLQTFFNGATAPRLVSSNGTPEEVMNSQFSPIQINGTPAFQPWQICVPLKAGIFNCYSEEKLTPILGLGGLKIELTLQSNALSLVPITPVKDGSQVRIVTDQTTAVAVAGVTTTQITWTQAGLTVVGSELHPGQIVYLRTDAVPLTASRITSIVQGAGVLTINHETAVDMTGANPRLIFGLPCHNGSVTTLLRVSGTTIEESGFCVGQTLSFSDLGTTAVKNVTITAMTQSLTGIVTGASSLPDLIGPISPTTPGSADGTDGVQAGLAVERYGVALVGCEASATVAGTVCTDFTITTSGTTDIFPGDVLSIITDQTTAPTFVATNGHVELTVDTATDASGLTGQLAMSSSQWSSQASYSVESLEYRAQQISPPGKIVDKISKGMTYSFRSWDLFYDSIPAASRRHQIEIPSVSSMAKCIMSHFVSSSYEQDPNIQQYYTGMTPDELKLNSLQYFINNKLFPLRDYDPRVLEDRPQVYNELQKAFSAMGTGAKSFGDASGSNLNGYSNTFLACRELARGRYVYSLREAEPSVRLAFTGSRDEIVRVNTFVWSDRVIRVDGSGLSVIL